MTITIKYSPTNLADVVDAYNAVAADLAGYGYTISTTPPAPASAPVEQQSVQTAENTDALPVDQTLHNQRTRKLQHQQHSQLENQHRIRTRPLPVQLNLTQHNLHQ